MVSLLHPDPTKLVRIMPHSYTLSFVYGQINPKTVPIHPGLRYEVLLSGDSYEAKSHAPFSYGLLAIATWYE